MKTFFVKNAPRIITFAVLFLVTASICAEAQSQFEENIQKKWIKTELRMADGSAVYRPELMYMQLQYKFLSKDSLQLTLDGITSLIDYSVKDSVLAYGNSTLRFFIKQLTDVKLVLKEISKKEESEKLVLEFIPQKFYDLGYVPTTYLAKNNDVVFLADENHIYPYFVNSKLPAIAFISEKFDFPEWRRGNFLARFIITQKGELVGIRVEESTNPKYNSKLVEAIKKTEGMWLPAEFDGGKVTSEVVMEFKMDFPTYQSDKVSVDKLELSQQQLVDGNYYFEEKLYRSAISSYTESIKNDFKNVDAYYRRAAAYVFMKEMKKACEDYEQLMYLKQTKATELYTKYCEGTESKTN
jgi:tetratricopeptide (TPR) repeat protein